MSTRKNQLFLISYVIIIVILLSGCGQAHTVSTSGQIQEQKNGQDNPFKDNNNLITVPTIAYINGFNDYYRIITKNMSSINDSYITEKLDADFLKWMCNNYDQKIAKQLAESLKSGSYTSDFWYKSTGCTFHVLWDYYTHNSSDNLVYMDKTSADSIKLAFAGDLCLSENWYTINKYEESGEILNQCISQNLIDELNSADIFMLNNEFSFSTRGEPLNGKLYTFRTDPSRISILKELGTDVVSVSNNHVYDYGADAFYDTLDTLKNNDIKYFGGGKNLDEASRPVYYIVNGMKIGFVGASRAEKIRFTPGAGTDSPGILLTYDSTKYLDVISSAKKECDYLVAYVHWGTEDSHKVTDYQQTMGHQFIDAGADVVVGGHPHVLQGIEYYNDKPIFYSLGDFWFNYETKETGAIELELSQTGVKNIKFLPCMQENYTTSLKTDPVETRRIYDFLQNLSFNAVIDDSGNIKKN